MEFLGSELGTLARVVVALLVVLGLIALTFWVIRRFGPITFNKTGVARGRQPRLALLESTAIDARRRLVLIRRDNVEHLLLVGGPTDVVVEPNILRAASVQTQPAPMPSAAREPIARAAGRPAMLDPMEEHEPSLVPAPSPEPFVLTPAPASELPPPLPPAPEHRSAPAPRIDPQYAEMAQRLEAALRRPPETRPVPPPPTAAHPSAAQAPAQAPAQARVEPRAPEPKPVPAAPPPAPKTIEPRMPKPSAPPPPVATAPAPPPPKSTLKRDVFDNLEEEMANLLGRGDNKKAG
ncbi:MAG TPA: flagellar biosynthetic protein FliO [Xanthobacteraceae bacterium]|jgi:flagellar biogenesis protein FliO